MNSIMEIGDNIIFLREGHKEWQGSRHEIFYADNAALNDFVFAGDLFKMVRDQLNVQRDDVQCTKDNNESL